jgi:hypothetical protein
VGLPAAGAGFPKIAATARDTSCGAQGCKNRHPADDEPAKPLYRNNGTSSQLPPLVRLLRYYNHKFRGIIA